MKLYCIYSFLIALFYLTGCKENASSQSRDNVPYETAEFKNYWHSGKAEIASYKLDQARYGENHKGSAVLIFVTEPFSKTKQVKLDDYTKAGSDHVSVLKLNYTKKFVTGIYPYSMMLSAFTPVDHQQHPNTLKITMSSQEWCGHVFSQVNKKGNKYDVQSYSYFEQEGDEDISLPVALLEDEIWNIIRLDPLRLPVGQVEIIPGLFFTRLHHQPLRTLKATATRVEEKNLIVYTLSYPETERSLEIKYEKDFPHKILGWQESFKHQGRVLTTTATLDKTLHIDYWTKNKSEFRHLYDSLGLVD